MDLITYALCHKSTSSSSSESSTENTGGQKILNLDPFFYSPAFLGDEDLSFLDIKDIYNIDFEFDLNEEDINLLAEAFDNDEIVSLRIDDLVLHPICVFTGPHDDDYALWGSININPLDLSPVSTYFILNMEGFWGYLANRTNEVDISELNISENTSANKKEDSQSEPSTIEQVQANWDTTDSSDPSFIQNKPFGEESRALILKETVLTPTNQNNTQQITDSLIRRFEIGEWYIFTIDGIEYKMQCLPILDGTTGACTDDYTFICEDFTITARLGNKTDDETDWPDKVWDNYFIIEVTKNSLSTAAFGPTKIEQLIISKTNEEMLPKELFYENRLYKLVYSGEADLSNNDPSYNLDDIYPYIDLVPSSWKRTSMGQQNWTDKYGFAHDINNQTPYGYEYLIIFDQKPYFVHCEFYNYHDEWGGYILGDLTGSKVPFCFLPEYGSLGLISTPAKHTFQIYQVLYEKKDSIVCFDTSSTPYTYKKEIRTITDALNLIAEEINSSYRFRVTQRYSPNEKNIIDNTNQYFNNYFSDLPHRSSTNAAPAIYESWNYAPFTGVIE